MTKVMLVMATGLLLSGCIIDDRRPIDVGLSVGVAPAPVLVSGPPLWAPAYGRRSRVYQYYYYPDAGVYYNVVTSSYFYLDGGQWQVGVSLPSTLFVNPNAYVSLDLATDRPYLYYHEHRNLYRSWRGGSHGYGREYGRQNDRGRRHGHGHGHDH